MPALNALIASENFEVVAVVTQADKPVGRKQILTFSPVKSVALKNGIPVLQPTKLKNNIDFWEAVSLFGADINVVVAYGKILPQQILDSAPHGSVNIHGSALPKYRGASPIHAAIVNGDTKTQATIQKMVFEMDEGPIIGVGPVIEILDTDTYQTLSERMAESVVQGLPQMLVDYIEGRITPVPQDNSKASKVSLLTKEDGLIDWKDDEKTIWRKVRAYSVWPIAHTTIDDMGVQLLDVEYDEDVKNPKGKVALIDDDLFIGKLKINMLQVAGRNSMSGKDFLRGYSKHLGSSVL